MPNLLEWLDTFLSHSTSINARWKSQHTTAEYWVEQAKRIDKFIRTKNFHTEFSYTAIPDELLVLNDDHKTQIREKVEFFHADGVNNFYSDMWLLTRILADYERSEALSDPVAIAVLELREYINDLFEEFYPQEFAEVKAVLENIRKGHVEKPKIVCVECGSEDIVSSGINWICNSCSRSFRKKPRRKHYHKSQ